MDAGLIFESLEAVAAKGDPMRAVYTRLFELHPETEALFILGDAAKGHMLDEVLNAIIDFIGPKTYAPILMQIEVVNHENLGVAPRAFMVFFEVIRSSFRDFAGESWTPRMDVAWTELLDQLKATFGADLSHPTPPIPLSPISS